MPDGHPRPLELDLDESEAKQDFRGANRLLLHTGNADAKLAAAVFLRVVSEYTVAPKVNFVEVVIGGQSWGSYLSYKSFDKNFVADEFGSKKGERWFARPGTQPLASLGIDAAAYKTAYQLKSGGEDDAHAWDQLAEVCAALAKGGTETGAFIDIDQVLWSLALERVFAVHDGVPSGSSGCALYQGSDSKFRVIHYGGAQSFGIDSQAKRQTVELPLIPEDSDGSLLARLCRNPDWKSRYLAHARTITQQSVNWEVIGPAAEEAAAALKRVTGEPQTKAVAKLKHFTGARRHDLSKQLKLGQLPVVFDEVSQEWAGDGALPPPNEPITVNAKVTGAEAVVLHVATGKRGAFSPNPMQLGSNGAFVAEIPGLNAGSLVRYYVEARTARGVAYQPPQAEFRPTKFQFDTPKNGTFSVVLSEVMAANTKTLEDPQGDFDDYIELYNASDKEVDISGHCLSDKSTKLNKWTFPEGTKIAAKGHLLVWADEDGKDEEGLHANFKLSKKGETIFLADTAENKHAVLDKLSFKNLGADEAYARSEDAEWSKQEGTPGAPNPVPDQ